MQANQIDFKDIGLNIPNYIQNYDDEKKIQIYKFLKQLNETEKKAYSIAFDHLGSSFNIFKSNGFKEWKKNN